MLGLLPVRCTHAGAARVPLLGLPRFGDAGWMCEAVDSASFADAPPSRCSGFAATNPKHPLHSLCKGCLGLVPSQAGTSHSYNPFHLVKAAALKIIILVAGQVTPNIPCTGCARDVWGWPPGTPNITFEAHRQIILISVNSPIRPTNPKHPLHSLCKGCLGLRLRL